MIFERAYVYASNFAVSDVSAEAGATTSELTNFSLLQ